MKPTLLFSTAAAILTLAAGPSSAQPAYPLTCVFEAGQTVGISPSLSRPTTDLTVGFAFRAATKPAAEGVDPGTCAWQDRGFRPGEPTTVMLITQPNWRYLMLSIGGQTVPVLAPTGALWAPQAQPGYRVTLRVYRSEPDAGLAVPFLRVVE
jgi:hypothetical protein